MWISWASSIQSCRKGLLVELGPTRLTLIAERNGKPFLKAARRGVEQAVQALCEVSKFWAELKKPAIEVKAEKYSKVVRLMVEACQITGDDTLTPMAAVAGAIADIAAEAAQLEGAERVIVENRGDLAVKLSGGTSARIGVKANIKAQRCSFTIKVNGYNGVGGVATSGIGGMGFTKGIASAAVALASTGVLADACSTILGNATIDEDAPVVWKLAEELDPLTDLKGQLVTYKVGKLTEESKIRAVKKGIRKVEELKGRGILKGGIIVVEDFFAMSPKAIANVEDEKLHQIIP